MSKRVYDAQQAGALAVIIIFDLHDAEPFVLEEVRVQRMLREHCTLTLTLASRTKSTGVYL
jgi:hypothetical protein